MLLCLLVLGAESLFFFLVVMWLCCGVEVLSKLPLFPVNSFCGVVCSCFPWPCSVVLFILHLMNPCGVVVLPNSSDMFLWWCSSLLLINYRGLCVFRSRSFGIFVAISTCLLQVFVVLIYLLLVHSCDEVHFFFFFLLLDILAFFKISRSLSFFTSIFFYFFLLILLFLGFL